MGWRMGWGKGREGSGKAWSTKLGVVGGEKLEVLEKLVWALGTQQKIRHSPCPPEPHCSLPRLPGTCSAEHIIVTERIL